MTARFTDSESVDSSVLKTTSQQASSRSRVAIINSHTPLAHFDGLIITPIFESKGAIMTAFTTEKGF